MAPFAYQDGELLCDGVSVADLAREHGTPTYVYSAAALRHHFRTLRDAFAQVDPLICYAVKANYNLAVCHVLREEGAGFDIVSGGELFRALHVGADPKTICYAGVGKTRPEIEYALEAGILMFNVESRPELERIASIACEVGAEAGIGVRVNPGVDANTHRHTTTGTNGTKFGVDFDVAAELVEQAGRLPGVRLMGVHVHLGSPVNSPEPYDEAIGLLADFIERCRSRGARIDWIDVGGGFGVEYQGGETATPKDYAEVIVPHVRRSGCRAILEPGRYLVANAAVLVTEVQYVKESGGKTFVICDAGMNDLLRPALYDAFHRIWPVRCNEPVPHGAEALAETGRGRVVADVVGPVCETGDSFAKDRPLPPVAQGDFLALFSAGAYGYSMSSNYNSRPRACEVMVDGGTARVTRERESYEDLIVRERSELEVRNP